MTEMMLATAIVRMETVELHYRDESGVWTAREVEPLGIRVDRGGTRRLMAWCRLRDEPRSFRLDRIWGLAAPIQRFNPFKVRTCGSRSTRG
jgi:predicted DNA-binding transcriptional regulator YafY